MCTCIVVLINYFIVEGDYVLPSKEIDAEHPLTFPKSPFKSGTQAANSRKAKILKLITSVKKLVKHKLSQQIFVLRKMYCVF